MSADAFKAPARVAQFITRTNRRRIKKNNVDYIRFTPIIVRIKIDTDIEERKKKRKRKKKDSEYHLKSR